MMGNESGIVLVPAGWPRLQLVGVKYNFVDGFCLLYLEIYANVCYLHSAFQISSSVV